MLVSVLCLGLVMLTDWLLITMETGHRYVAVFASLGGFISITSINFMGALQNGFITGSLAFYVICLASTRLKPQPAPVPTSRQIAQQAAANA